MKTITSAHFYEMAPEQIVFYQDICKHLSEAQKSLPVKYLYDEAGMDLLEHLSRTEEYYLPRCELAIMRQHVHEITSELGERCALIEYGCGNGEKLRLLLNHLVDPCGYITIDVSEHYLSETAQKLHVEYPALEILPVRADFTKLLPLPMLKQECHQKVIYFPGAGIGELHPPEAKTVLRNMRLSLNKHDGLLVGIDLKKDEDVLNRAYNDNAGYARAFTQNILHRINKELEGNFKPEWFEHQSFFDAQKSRVEIGLISRYSHVVNIWDEQFSFDAGERIPTQYAYKYTVKEFEQLAEEAGFQLNKYWTDPKRYFAVLHFKIKPSKS